MISLPPPPRPPPPRPPPSPRARPPRPAPAPAPPRRPPQHQHRSLARAARPRPARAEAGRAARAVASAQVRRPGQPLRTGRAGSAPSLLSQPCPGGLEGWAGGRERGAPPGPARDHQRSGQSPTQARRSAPGLRGAQRGREGASLTGEDYLGGAPSAVSPGGSRAASVPADEGPKLARLPGCACAGEKARGVGPRDPHIGVPISRCGVWPWAWLPPSPVQDPVWWNIQLPGVLGGQVGLGRPCSGGGGRGGNWAGRCPALRPKVGEGGFVLLLSKPQPDLPRVPLTPCARTRVSCPGARRFFGLSEPKQETPSEVGLGTH